VPDYPTIITERIRVSNQQPILEPHPYKIAIVGEAPSEKEEDYQLPFVGPAGSLLNSVLKDVGIDRNRVFVGNVCQVRPPQNNLSLFPWSSSEIQEGLAQLKHDLTVFDPNICVLLGNAPLRAARGIESKVSSWSGSLFVGHPSSPFASRKCISSFHPSSILREWGADGNFPRLKHTLVRAKDEAQSKLLILPSRELVTDLDAQTLCRIMDEWPAGQRCSVDIEGGLAVPDANEGVRKDSKKRRHLGWRCVALAGRTTRGFCIAWWKFNDLEFCNLLRSFARLMGRTDVPKVLQNSLYDNFVMAYSYGILIRNVVEDTMLKGWEVYCELPKSLACQASIYTREPHWKDEEMYESNGENLALGCCKDVTVTLEICEAQDSCLDKLGLEHYQKNVAMLNPALYMELRGMNYDQVSVAKKIKEVQSEITPIGDRLSELAKEEVRGPSGCIADKRLAGIMYQKLGYPPQFKKEKGRATTKFTTDIEALLKLRRSLESDEFLNGVIKHRHLEGLLETLNIKADPDGRVRCAYNVVGTETGRFSCKTSPTGAGANMTTITKKLRGNYIADNDYDFFQCDLAGADGWTVAAHCSRLGDDTMLLDYQAGLKPAKIISGLHCFGTEFNNLNRDDLQFWGGKTPFSAISKAVGSGIYDCSKVIQHGSNYLMGIPTMQTNVMKKSFKENGIPIYMDHREASMLQAAYFIRYGGVRLWHNWSEAKLVSSGELVSATGHKRVFFGRRFGKDIHDTVKEFLADEPQQNTTWATNLAMLALWRDPANRIAWVDRTAFCVGTCDGVVHYWAGSMESFRRITPGGLLIEPLHQVHDALCGQWPKFLRDWARAKVKSYFQNPLTIAGISLIIPFDGTYGSSWGDMPNSL